MAAAWLDPDGTGGEGDRFRRVVLITDSPGPRPGEIADGQCPRGTIRGAFMRTSRRAVPDLALDTADSAWERAETGPEHSVT